ncbi:hypothetical protein GGI16_000089 [Coemansia sp. S142-1]|nr:hypothetical protein GGI16_000089 [Coemansia sp. S142-1]
MYIKRFLQQWRFNKEKRVTRERQQRRRVIAKRRKQIPELALSHRNAPAPASSPNSVLQLVFDYLSPVPGPASTSKELIAHLRCLQRVAAVNRERHPAPIFEVGSHLAYHTKQPRYSTRCHTYGWYLCSLD